MKDVPTHASFNPTGITIPLRERLSTSNMEPIVLPELFEINMLMVSAAPGPTTVNGTLKEVQLATLLPTDIVATAFVELALLVIALINISSPGCIPLVL